MPSPSTLTAGLLLALAGGIAAGQIPVVNIFVLPDDNGGPASESMLSGTIPGPAGPVAVAFDVTEPLTSGEVAFLTSVRTAGDPQVFDVVDCRIEAVDPALGSIIQLTRIPGSPGTLQTTGPGGSLGAGAAVTLTVPVAISWSGRGGFSSPPASGVLSLGGTFVPGYFHQIVTLVGGIDTLPGVSVSLLAKQDLFIPGIDWEMVADPAASSATRSGGMPEAVQGALVLDRHVSDYRIYSFGQVSFDLPAAPPLLITSAPGAGGGLVLDPLSRMVTGTINWVVDGTPVTRVLDGVGELFEGPATMPTRLRIEESGLGGLQDLVLDLRRCEIVPGPGGPAILGANYQPIFRGRPGAIYAIAAALDPSPGLNTPVGDVPTEPDFLFFFSLDPANGFFTSMIGVVPPGGAISPSILIPGDPGLAGLTFFLGGALLDAAGGGILAATNTHRVVL